MQMNNSSLLVAMAGRKLSTITAFLLRVRMEAVQLPLGMAGLDQKMLRRLISHTSQKYLSLG